MTKKTGDTFHIGKEKGFTLPAGTNILILDTEASTEENPVVRQVVLTETMHVYNISSEQDGIVI